MERPGVGDLSRNSIAGPGRPGQPDLPVDQPQQAVSISVDTRTEEGRAVIRRLVRDADVVVSNFRAGVMERIGFGYEALKAINPKLDLGLGHRVRRHRPVRAQGRSGRHRPGLLGVMWRRESDDIPLSVYPTTLCDYTTGMHLMQGILLALLARERTGAGRRWR